jgi:hypothetical protein
LLAEAKAEAKEEEGRLGSKEKEPGGFVDRWLKKSRKRSPGHQESAFLDGISLPGSSR